VSFEKEALQHLPVAIGRDAPSWPIRAGCEIIWISSSPTSDGVLLDAKLGSVTLFHPLQTLAQGSFRPIAELRLSRVLPRSWTRQTMYAAGLGLLRTANPMAPKPSSIIAHVDGSGTAASTARISPPGNWEEWTFR
jgi:hypothetical protein